MMATSDSTAFSAMRIATNTGTLTRKKVLVERFGAGAMLRPRRPRRRNTSTGMTIEPTAPRGSRMNTLISIQVSRHKPRSMISSSVLGRQDQQQRQQNSFDRMDRMAG